MKDLNGKEKVQRNVTAYCRICEELFNRQVETKYYCRCCESAYCDEQHGRFFGYKNALCIICRGYKS